VGRLASLWRWQVRNPLPVDAALAIAVFVAAIWDPLFGGHRDFDHGRPGPHVETIAALDALTVLLLAIGAGALVFRRSHPLLVWATGLAVAVALVAHTGDPAAAVGLSLLTLYTIGAHTSLGTTVLATLTTAAIYTASVAAAEGFLSDRNLTLVASTGAAAAVGIAVRAQRAAVAAAEARARQAEATREEEAERRVTDERLRIARELHDVVAHHISVVNVQAGVARHLLDTRPEQAKEALGLVREASRTVLAEMSTVLGLLRTGEDEDVPTAPAPGLDQVDALVETMASSGLRTTLQTRGEPRPLAQLADLAAYRVVQESLTNALKHGSGTAELLVDHRPDTVAIEVLNPVRAADASSPGTGHGLVGMRERIAAVAGRLTAGPEPDGSFAVRAEIPRDAP
jgi:signal transduction histidine kinase